MPIGPQGQPLPYGMPAAGAANPFLAAEPSPSPIQSAGEDAITKLLQMASSSPQLLIGLSMAGAAREISQLTGLSRRRQGGGQAAGRGGAMPSAATLLGGNTGDLDRLIALQTMMGGAGAPMGMPPAAMPQPPVAAPPSPMGGGMPPQLAALLGGAGAGGGLPPQLAGLV